MDDQENRKGAVFIRTQFGEQHESVYRLCRAQMILDKDWRRAVGAQGGPFCYTNEECLMPF